VIYLNATLDDLLNVADLAATGSTAKQKAKGPATRELLRLSGAKGSELHLVNNDLDDPIYDEYARFCDFTRDTEPEYVWATSVEALRSYLGQWRYDQSYRVGLERILRGKLLTGYVAHTSNMLDPGIWAEGPHLVVRYSAMASLSKGNKKAESSRGRPKAKAKAKRAGSSRKVSKSERRRSQSRRDEETKNSSAAKPGKSQSGRRQRRGGS